MFEYREKIGPVLQNSIGLPAVRPLGFQIGRVADQLNVRQNHAHHVTNSVLG